MGRATGGAHRRADPGAIARRDHTASRAHDGGHDEGDREAPEHQGVALGERERKGVAELSATFSAIDDYRERFDAEAPEAVSLVEAGRDESVEAVWESLSTWQTLERRATILDAARRDGVERGAVGRRIDV